MGKISELYGDAAKRTLKEDALMVKELTNGYTKSNFQDMFGNVKKRFTLIDAQGNILYDSERYTKEDEMANHRNREEVKEAFETGEGFAIRKSKTLRQNMAYYGLLNENSEGEKTVIRTSISYDEEIKDLRTLLVTQIFFFIILNIAIYICYKNYLKRDLFKKIESMREALESGDEIKTIYAKGDVWLVKFWKVVRDWQKENLKNIRKLNEEKTRLKRVISAVDLSIILADEESKIIMKNNALGYLYVNGKLDSIYKKVKYIEILNVINKGMKTKENIKEEIFISKLKKYLLVTVKYLEFKKEFLITIKDITRSRELGEIQKNFIANVSHELKTPLTNIKGYLIALEDAPQELQKNFLDIIRSNVEKLENITMDFLNISKIESSKIINLAPVPFERVKDEVEKILNGKVKKSGAVIEYNLDLKDENNYMNIDFEKTVTVLKNLIENGIIYNNKVPHITVSIKEEDDRYRVSVKDNGIGFPEQEKDNIFERFYRIDKARTSNVAGTGLGLSIVKETVDICGGKIEVFSSENEGSEFIFTLLK
ncbi:two-component sensor histidine kinase [Fusobacterium perfoetens]|uniref:sensor histidine kinase n=1 Tax=Fusobacterium perfoetens TaxID=852 RepID=UPI001F22422B|nr:HAMP domain-containing sensor histidine kinase [Fusobacterium perfoetens]MCF2625629.1 two-component sensor histidine kinase [Fusobacterium perfoetens]